MIETLIALILIGGGVLLGWILMIPRMYAYEAKIKRLEVADSNCTCSEGDCY